MIKNKTHISLIAAQLISIMLVQLDEAYTEACRLMRGKCYPTRGNPL